MATSASTGHKCPECGGRINTTTTEHACVDCGLVLEDKPIDHGPDWGRSDDPNERRERAKPGNRNRADRGLGSIRYSRGKVELRRDRWQSQARGDGNDRRRDYATTEIQRVASALELGDSLAEQAKTLFRQLHDDGEVANRDMDTLAAACVLVITRQHQRGLTAGDIAPVARADEMPIQRRYRMIVETLGVPVPPPRAESRLRVVAAELDADDDTLADAITLCEAVPDHERTASPSTLAAACLYAVSGKRWTQAEVAEAAGRTPVSIRNRYTELPTEVLS